MTHFVDGAHNVICDRTGFKVKSTDTRKEWNGRVVRNKSFEERQPQDLLRSVKDRQRVDDPRPEGTDTFLTTNQVQASDL